MEYTISKKRLDKICDDCSRCLVGEALKRFEIHEDRDTIKKEVREVIYENIRTLKKIIIAFSSGVKFVTDSKQKKSV